MLVDANCYAYSNERSPRFHRWPGGLSLAGDGLSGTVNPQHGPFTSLRPLLPDLLQRRRRCELALRHEHHLKLPSLR